MIIWTSVIVLLHILFILRILTRPHRQPASRIAWIVVVLTLPIFGVLAYIYFREVNIGNKRIIKLDKIIKHMPHTILGDESNLQPNFKMTQKMQKCQKTSCPKKGKSLWKQ